MKDGKTIKVWDIAKCGWHAYFGEVAIITRGRDDVRIENPHPGVIRLVALRADETGC